jgi:hypothetical protein
MAKKLECGEYRCHEAPYRNGLCEEHYEKSQRLKRRRDAAINTLHIGVVDGRLPDNQELREELIKIRKWWHRVCGAVNNNSEDEILREETSYALEWCIAIAQEIIDEELAYRGGNSESFSKDISKEIKRLAWEHFENLEAGLMSNGVARQSR